MAKTPNKRKEQSKANEDRSTPKNEHSKFNEDCSIPKDRLFKVFLHNDDRTTMDLVVFILKSVFDKSNEDALKIMYEVHNQGTGVAGSYSLEIAVEKAFATKAIARSKGYPLKCTVEDQEDEEGASEEAKHKAPRGWFIAGSFPDDYGVGTDTTVCHSGNRCAYLRHAVDEPRGFGTLMQGFSPQNYFEKRLRMTMWVKTSAVRGRVQPWMRIDGRRKSQMLGFDNCCERAITGSTDWQSCEIVLDIPRDSTNIAFGIILSGRGCVWIDDISFDEVSQDTATTDCKCNGAPVDRGPRNLDFAED
ncbi:MAG TPA: ATP-dependent Clp protease adaptor ClpS [Trichormus sp.]|jgi:ATP-dependent Clp protease adapter protein ClpS